MEGIEQFFIIIVFIVLAIGQWIMDKVRKARQGQEEEDDLPDWFPENQSADDTAGPDWREILTQHEQRPPRSIPPLQGAPPHGITAPHLIRGKQAVSPPSVATTTVKKGTRPSWDKPLSTTPDSPYKVTTHQPYKRKRQTLHSSKRIKLRTLLQRQNLRSIVIGAEIIGEPVALRNKDWLQPITKQPKK